MAAGVASYHRDDEGVRRREAAKASLAEYLIAQIEARRARPNGDLICMMANSEIARGLPNAHLVQNVRQLLFAGNESTAKWLAQIFLTYAQRDDVRRELIADPSLVPAANDEVMRWAGVVGTGLRRVTEPTQLAGVAMQPGQDVTVLIAAANRDPARYADPDRFDIHRPHQPNLGFGVGLHFCLGINLAKLEVERVVNAFLARMPDYVVTAPVTYSTLAMRGPHPLIIALDR
jgi:cytochrome P450